MLEKGLTKMPTGQKKYNLSRVQYYVLIIVSEMGEKCELDCALIRRIYKPEHKRRDTHLNRVVLYLTEAGFIEASYGKGYRGKRYGRAFFTITKAGWKQLEIEHKDFARILSLGD